MAEVAPTVELKQPKTGVPTPWIYLVFVCECYFCLAVLAMLHLERNWTTLLFSTIFTLSLFEYARQRGRQLGLGLSHGTQIAMLATFYFSIPAYLMYVRGWRFGMDLLALIGGLIAAGLLAVGFTWVVNWVQ